ncbi:TonB-dependent receptor [Sphingomonas sp. 28-63-12]|uniref:TonB-dependent receptor n=1 Tax=Sphingomonas sp. 28-63-12 TaxID=1970434 RepID=UPI000BD0FD88|nr:MAG: TonB-dependent receptor [Sphingomonas sp. 28-63-12]
MRNQLFLGAAVAALIMPAAASAQETTAVIRGSVTSNGAPVNDATLVITHVPSGTVSRTSTDSSGSFSASGLRSGGPYTIDVTSAEGNTQVSSVYTVIGQPYDLPIDVSASTSADIIVTASSIKGAGAASDGPQTILNQVDISKVASVNRDIRDIERRDPFATIDLTNSRAVSFAGTNPRFNRFTINGAQVGDTFGLNPDASPTRRGPVPFDAIGQVSVSIAPYDIRQTNFQGGVIDTTLLSGTNEYHLNGFYSQSTDGLQGNQIQALTVALPKYKSETYGVTVSGPIIKDKLFIAGSYERNTDPRPLTPGAVNQVPGLTDAALAQIQSIAKSVYNYEPGGILPITNNLDEKFSVKLDWNIASGQRFSFSYINSFDAQDNPQNSSQSTTSPSIGLESNAYKLTELLRVGIAQLNSDWSDQFSTEARFSYKSYTRGQDPELGRGFAQFIVCTAPTSVNTGTNTLTSCGTGVPTVAFGPDISRQTNALFTDTYDGSFLARYKAGDHDFKVLAQYVENRTTNAFLQRSAGAYYFDSIADLQNRTASQFDYANALTLNPNDTTASFRYGVYSIGVQDDWQILSNLRVSVGARYDSYDTTDTVGLNSAFVSRYGFSNTRTFKGLQAFQPRLSFNYKPVSNLVLRGGVGIFAAGTPDIYFSNSYSNTGANQNRISSVIRATPTGGNALTCTAPYTGANAAVCTAALNNVQGTSIPGLVNSYLTTNTASLATAGTASVAPDFRTPSQTRATLSADYKLFGIDFGADYLFSKVNQGVTFTDLRSRQIGFLPDGRPRYTFVATPGVIGQTVDTNSDIQIRNTSLGRSHIFVVRFEKEFKAAGVTLGGSYTWQDVKDVSNATSSVAASLYNAQAVSDPNNAAYGTSSDQTKWQFKYSIGYDHAFFRDYRTVIQLFGETRAGRPYSFTAQDTSSGRSAVFGTLGNNNHYLLYVPTSTTDPLVSYDTQATQDSLEALIGSTALKNYRGQIAAKNIARSRANTRIDLHLEQEIPTFIGKSRITLFADIENLPNLLNKNWGGVTQLGFPSTADVVRIQCLATPTATGGVAVANTVSTQTCAQYRYSTYRAPSETLTSAISLYLIRLGVRVKF